MGQEGYQRVTRAVLILMLLCQTGALVFELGVGMSQARRDANLVRQRGEEERCRRAFWREVSLRVESGQLTPADVTAIVTQRPEDEEL